MESDPDSESGENTTIPKKETTLGRTQEVPPGQEDVTPPPPVSDVLGRLTTTLHQLSAVTGHRERWNRYDGSYEAQSFFTNYDAQADQYQLQYSTRLRKPANLLQAPLRVTNTRAYTSWMEVVPLPDMKSETVARAFYENRIVRFGAPHTVISDQGKQFTSQLFKDLTTLCGIKLRHFTAYHPQCNGKIERLHRTIKTAIRAHNSIKWTETLPTVLLGLRAAINKDNNHSLSQMVYGKTIRLPGEFFDASKHHLHAEEFVQQLQKQMTDRVKKPLEPPYEGPFPVLERTDKYFTLKVKGKNVTTSIDRLRPAYLLADSDNITAEHPTATRPIVSGALPSTSSQQNTDPPDVEKYTEFQGTGSAPDLPRTRSGRIIKKPVRFKEQ
ncbi:hypothetical protein LAZ67_5002549 [Cordylochernes scorpioides]|uniref:Integrase catalytic domain-containing protein n=1 Tax=Cordylochernes scorpioides TaxID=51811 RepID=A0ABY6KGI1_9ARAC|nr:hypothetical protein LAZ67_5002549 [Cordylochernes scorpioides]